MPRASAWASGAASGGGLRAVLAHENRMDRAAGVENRMDRHISVALSSFRVGWRRVRVGVTAYRVGATAFRVGWRRIE
jgi:hypothetical protein